MRMNISEKFAKGVAIIAIIVFCYSLYTPKPLTEPTSRTIAAQGDSIKFGHIYQADVYKGKMTVRVGDYDENGHGGNFKTIFESSRKHYVYEATILDITNDGKPELVTMLWKRGNYGGKKPLVDEGFELTDITKSPHIFIWTFDNYTIRPLWFSSMLPETPKEFNLNKLEKKDQEDKLYITWKNKNSAMPNVWEWRSWGLKSL